MLNPGRTFHRIGILILLFIASFHFLMAGEKAAKDEVEIKIDKITPVHGAGCSIEVTVYNKTKFDIEMLSYPRYKFDPKLKTNVRVPVIKVILEGSDMDLADNFDLGPMQKDQKDLQTISIAPNHQDESKVIFVLFDEKKAKPKYRACLAYIIKSKSKTIYSPPFSLP